MSHKLSPLNDLKTIGLSVIVSGASILIYHLFYSGYYIQDRIQHVAARAVADKEVQLAEKFLSRLQSAQTTNFMQAASMAKNAVVSIRAMRDAESMQSQSEVKYGSGVVVGSDGILVTNYHVVRDCRLLEVTLYDNRKLVGEIVGVDPYSDLAVLRIEASGLPTLVFGNSDSLQVGEWVLAVGNPMRLNSTVTAGIVSAKARQIQLLDHEGVEAFIQTDAVVNPGNSGGALVNTAGELIGICTAVVSESGNYEGFSFAIPSRIVQKVVADILEFGSVQKAWLGAEVVTVDAEIASKNHLKEVSGALITMVYQNGASAIAGIRRGDVLVGIDQSAIVSSADLTAALALRRPGDKVTLMFWRDRKKQTEVIELLNQANTKETLATLSQGTFKLLGIEVRDAGQRDKDVIPGAGAVVISVTNGSLAEKSSIQPGLVVVRCNGTPVYSAQDLFEKFSGKEGEKVRIEGYYAGFPGRYPYEFIIPVNRH
ncbi:MAG: trypsin-like peptidase domain-containing protein [Saprospiraceae bacterium]|nr:trypsin-like peptidase domain-containing protein [Saprospiraceae bacterium]